MHFDLILDCVVPLVNGTKFAEKNTERDLQMVLLVEGSKKLYGSFVYPKEYLGAFLKKRTVGCDSQRLRFLLRQEHAEVIVGL